MNSIRCMHEKCTSTNKKKEREKETDKLKCLEINTFTYDQELKSWSNTDIGRLQNCYGTGSLVPNNVPSICTDRYQPDQAKRERKRR